jgi:putative endonuclease
MTKQRKLLGTRGEDIACHHLEQQGVAIIERNWKCQSGEADIIAREEDDLIFVEVKTRSSTSTGFPEEAVTREKRRKYERIAMEYLFTHNLPSARIRFDVMALLVADDGKAFLRHHRDAFCEGE